MGQETEIILAKLSPPGFFSVKKYPQLHGRLLIAFGMFLFIGYLLWIFHIFIILRCTGGPTIKEFKHLSWHLPGLILIYGSLFFQVKGALHLFRYGAEDKIQEVQLYANLPLDKFINRFFFRTIFFSMAVLFFLGSLFFGSLNIAVIFW